ncbi:hypothetical protein ACWEPN_02380 [Nonomuraea wenchangensis]
MTQGAAPGRAAPASRCCCALGIPAQELDGARITRDHFPAFLDRHLRGRSTPVPAFVDQGRKAAAFSSAH